MKILFDVKFLIFLKYWNRRLKYINCLIEKFWNFVNFFLELKFFESFSHRLDLSDCAQQHQIKILWFFLIFGWGFKTAKKLLIFWGRKSWIFLTRSTYCSGSGYAKFYAIYVLFYRSLAFTDHLYYLSKYFLIFVRSSLRCELRFTWVFENWAEL